MVMIEAKEARKSKEQKDSSLLHGARTQPSPFQSDIYKHLRIYRTESEANEKRASGQRRTKAVEGSIRNIRLRASASSGDSPRIFHSKA